MRRILLVGDYPPPYGGLSVQMAALRARLAALPDTDVRVLDIGERRRERRADCTGVRTPLGFAARVLLHARDGDTVHLHTNGHNVKSWIAALVCAGAGTVAGRRAVISLGSGHMPSFLASVRGPVRAVARAAIRLAGALIVRNELGRDAVVRLGAAPGKVRILPGFYGVSEGEIGHASPTLARFRRTHDPLVGMVATPGAVYGLALLIDAAARLRADHPDLGVVLLGPDRLEEGAPSFVLPLGELDRPALLASMRDLDVFVRPTYYDGDASSVREALALGVRAVASETGFRPEGVTLFPVGDVDALAMAIETSLRSAPVVRVSTSLPELLAVYADVAGSPVSELVPVRNAAPPTTVPGQRSNPETKVA